jgi:hypothetical protein
LCVAVDYGGDVVAGVQRNVLRELMLNAMVPPRKGPKLGAVLRHRGYLVTLAAPTTGHLSVSWYADSNQLNVASEGPKSVLIATGHAAVINTARMTLRVTLTPSGTELLKRARRVHVVARGRFTPENAASVVAVKALTLTR